MKGHDSKQVRELFLALVDLSSNQQEPWLREQVKGDQELYDEVYSLLRFDDPSHDALECHLTELVYDTADQTPTDKQSNGVVDPVFGPLPEDRTAEPLSNPKELIGAIDSASTIESDHQSANVSLSERQRLSDIISHFHLPNYQLLQPIGMGAFGSVWKARDRRLQRVVAIKISHLPFLDADESDRAYREARLTARLSHPNIVSIHEIGEHQNHRYIVTDFIDGVSLSMWAKDREITVRQAAKIVAAIADALDHSHDHGVVHRDIKPSNIMMDRNNEPIVVDFGLARLIDSQPSMTIHHRPVGTPAYMPPEQASSTGVGIEARSDLYSLGVTLFELLTGERPFRGDTEKIVEQLLYSEPVGPKSLRGSIPTDLNTICLKCLQKKPADRYATARQLADDLRCFLEHRPISARPIGRIGKCYRWAIRNQKVASLSAISLILLVTLWVSMLIGYNRVNSALNETHTAVVKARQAAFKMHTKQGNVAFENGDPALAALWFSNASFHAELGSQQRKYSQVRTQAFLNSTPRLTGMLWHDGEPIETLEVSPCGRYVATTTLGRNCRVWDLNTQSMMMLQSRANCVAWSPDQQHFAIGLVDGNALLFNATKWDDPLPVFAGEAITAVQFSPDGRQLAIGGTGLHFWDVPAESFSSPRRELIHHVTALTYSPSGSQLAVSLSNKKLRLFELNQQAIVGPGQSIEHHSRVFFDYAPCLPAFTLQEDALVTARPRSADIVNIQGLNNIHHFPTPSVISGIAASADGKRVAVSGPKHLQVWNTDNGQPILFSNITRHHFSDLSFKPDGSMLAAASRDNHIVRLIRFDNVPSKPVNLQHSDWVRFARFSQQGKQLITAQRDGLVRLWDVEPDLDYRKQITIDGRKSRIKLSRDGSRILICGSARIDGTVDSAQVFETSTGLPISQRLNEGHLLIDAAFTPDGNSVVTADVNKELKRWNWRTGDQQGPSIALPKEPRAIAFDPTGNNFVVACTSGLLQFRNGQSPSLKLLTQKTHGSGQQIMLRSQQHTNAYVDPSAKYPWLGGEGIRRGNCLRFSQNGHLLITTCYDSSAQIWDLTSLDKKPRTLPMDQRTSHSSISANTKFVATTSRNKASVWDLVSGERLRTLEHPADIGSIQFSDDSQQLLTACDDGIVRCWNWRDGTLQSPPLSHPAGVNEAKYAQRSSLIITSSKDEQLRFWDATSGFMICPPLTINSDGVDIELSPDQKHIVVSAGGRQGNVSSVVNLHKLIDNDRLAVEDARQLAELFSGRETWEAGEMTLTTTQLLDRLGMRHVSLDRAVSLGRAREFERLAKWDEAIEQYRLLTNALPNQDAYFWLKRLDTSCWQEWDRHQSIDMSLPIWEQGRHALGNQEQELCLEVGAAAWSLITKNQAEYERICRIMLDRPIDRQTPRTQFQIARILALGNHSLIEPERMVEIAEKAIARDSSSSYFATALTHCLIRAQRYEEALVHCEGHAALTALCYAQMGQQKLARQWIETAQNESDIGPVDPRSDWFPTRRLVWQIYLQEAQHVLARN